MITAADKVADKDLDKVRPDDQSDGPRPDPGAVPMLSIGKLAAGQEHYYLGAVASGVEDYYSAQVRHLGSGSATAATCSRSPVRWTVSR